jgi:hypothetical protein
MNLPKILADLRQERDVLDEVMACLERLLATASKPRKGRPPAWLKAQKDSESKPYDNKQPARVVTAGSAQE